MTVPKSALLVALLSAVAGEARVPSRGAGDRTPAAPLAELGRCKAIADAAARLSCYDRATSVLLKAEQRADIIVVDAEEVKASRKSRFGLGDIDLPLLRHHGAQIEEITQIDGVIASASTDASGQWTFDLAGGGVWQQIDTADIGRSPRQGDPVLIKRASLGSYRLSVAKAPAVRVRRLR